MLAGLETGRGRAEGTRWVICGLLLVASAINYLDRQVLAILSATAEFRHITGFGAVEYGYANSLFQAAYALALPLAGRLADRIGTRLGYALAMGLWSLADLGHALARGPGGFFAARFALGLGEAGNFPNAIKTIGEWFPQRDRAFATGIFNAGTSLGALAAPLLVPWIYLRFGWRGAFVATALVGFVWVAVWLRITGRPATAAGAEPPSASRPTRTDAAGTATPGAAAPLTFRQLLRQRNAWAVAVAKLLTDPIWFFYLAWLPGFLASRHGIRIDTLGLPLAAIYLLSDVGSVAGGWAAGWLMRRGLAPARARRAVMLVAAILALSALLTARTTSLWGVVALVGLGTAAHQAWSANVYSLASDLFPGSAVGRVVGLAGMAGSLGGVLFHAVTGHVVAGPWGYQGLFAVAASAYLVAWTLIQILVRR